MEHTITNTPWNDNDMYADESARDEAARESDENATRERDWVVKACEQMGLLADEGYTAPGLCFYTADVEFLIDLTGDSGYVWSLKQFSDSDNAEGVATAHWVDALDMDGNNVEGDTLESFELALRFLNNPPLRNGKRWSRFPVGWDIDQLKAEAAESVREEAALADEADRQYHADVEEGF